MNADIIYRRLTNKAKFRHLSLLIQLHDLRNMKRAAEALGLSQPAVSLAVSELEKLLGVTLFLRHARGVEPTQTACDLVPVARRIMGALGDGSEIVSGALNESEGIVRIVAARSALAALVQPAIGRLSRKYPSVTLDIIEIETANPFEGIADKSCDILCARNQATAPIGWTFQPVLPDAMIVACGASHPLAQKATITREDLRSAEWLVHRPGSLARNRFEDFCEEIQLPEENRSGVISHVPVLTLELMRHQNYLAMLPRSVCTAWLRDKLVVELDCIGTSQLPDVGYFLKEDTATKIARKIAQDLKGG